MIDINSIIRALKFSSYNILLFMMILFISCEKRENVAEVETLQILEITDVSAKAEGNISSAGTNRIIEKGFCWSKIQILSKMTDSSLVQILLTGSLV